MASRKTTKDSSRRKEFSTSMKVRALFSVLASALLYTTVLVVGQRSEAQTTASCSFTTFRAPSGYSWPSPSGTNDYGTIVGSVLSPAINSVVYSRGLVRYSNGSMTTFNYPNKNGVFEQITYPGALATSASGINNYGTVVGSARMPANNGFGY